MSTNFRWVRGNPGRYFQQPQQQQQKKTDGKHYENKFFIWEFLLLEKGNRIGFNLLSETTTFR